MLRKFKRLVAPPLPFGPMGHSFCMGDDPLAVAANKAGDNFWILNYLRGCRSTQNRPKWRFQYGKIACEAEVIAGALVAGHLGDVAPATCNKNLRPAGAAAGLKS